MSAPVRLRRLRGFLEALAAALFLGTVAELLLEGHVEEPLQLVPFGLCALGLAALVALRARPGRGVVLAVRAIMGLIAIGSIVGVGAHVVGNLDFARETQPAAEASRLLVAALTGASPLLAPGILAVAAVLVAAATTTICGPEASGADGVAGETRAGAGTIRAGHPTGTAGSQREGTGGAR